MHKSPLAVCALCSMWMSAGAEEQAPALGREMSAAEVAAVDYVVLPDGAGLPEGAGDASAGKSVYQAHCIACHGEAGQNGINDPLAGGQGSIGGPTPTKTVGSYWPYATTLFDYIRRSMPYPNPGTLTNDELYAVTAYVLHVNGVVGPSDRIDAESLPKVKMPNRDNFVRVVDP